MEGATGLRQGRRPTPFREDALRNGWVDETEIQMDSARSKPIWKNQAISNKEIHPLHRKAVRALYFRHFLREIPIDIIYASRRWGRYGSWQLSGLLIVAFLAIVTTMTGAVSSTSPGVPLSSLVCAHLFEYLLDYVFVALLSIGLTRAAAEGLPLTRPSPAGETSRLP